MAITKKWWHDKVAYQIYPKSFRDTDGDGVGDLRGITQKLDYLKDLGIDILWICPVYPSPFVDQGYDISDYYDIDPAFGTMADLEELLAEAKKRDMYILMDLVINHCSDQHPWFRKALQDPFGKYGDYFYFRRGENGLPPSNTRSYFGGSTWEKVPGYEDLYYFHAYAAAQPDLNWENPEVLDELYTMVNWWLEKGVAGFRIDAIINIQKDISFPSYPPDGEDGMATVVRMVESVEGVNEKLQALKKNTFDRYDALTVGEVFNMRKDALDAFVGENGHFSTMFDFSVNCLSDGPGGWYRNREITFRDFRETLFHSQLECQGIGFLANFLENHDEPRGSSRYLPPCVRNEQGMKMLATVSILLRGIPFLFQGQEIGMTNCPMVSVEEYNDINTKAEYALCRQAGLSDREALNVCQRFSRDNGRTPMQWDASPNAGFTTGTPWLKVNPNYVDINVAEQEGREDSILNYYRRLIALRKSPEYREVFTYGEFVPLFREAENILAYRRVLEGRETVVIANFGPEEAVLPADTFRDHRLLLTNAPAETASGAITLKSAQVIVLGR